MLTGLGCGYSARRPNNRTGPDPQTLEVVEGLDRLVFSNGFKRVETEIGEKEEAWVSPLFQSDPYIF